MTNSPTTVSAAKPVLRGLHNATIKKNLTIALALTAVVTVGWSFLINRPKKEAYAEFYKNYDAQKSFERMKANGRFQGC
ncbi:PREDICTED: cytochrome c oxidase subunit 6C-1 [Rhagoletis zephyria]|uniref:cytochrome c oxidase subunit 6C-1 n=1 Tax=Rhagoletis zephyria TaxID=28612 RepID=UPI000811987D|nr:PREDICTED: cytochrome c oxidase subunit 6C-1 [Rhagoletis zephyria]XP_017483004.1 PREDICTED: cytochrome c oxidase subunit 6C-1 [Rhagoletis zephyria]XP_017483005.1 PREDICTED: cytochrome c oxidase subunit 6C-1 [Rhagoletis zephyria]XP_036322493.1 cytochrome c oxidase subunit 6C-1 [Rhagoletis pomonella]XP_036322494.1 cytochrome c oxidase subunit 6C-1 [Rhagoletis pomonella]XP_036322495.1 cytochrome c oxidase subunit 6C-1 [Rhagoletis pomonella]